MVEDTENINRNFFFPLKYSLSSLPHSWTLFILLSFFPVSLNPFELRVKSFVTIVCPFLLELGWASMEGEFSPPLLPSFFTNHGGFWCRKLLKCCFWAVLDGYGRLVLLIGGKPWIELKIIFFSSLLQRPSLRESCKVREACLYDNCIFVLLSSKLCVT